MNEPNNIWRIRLRPHGGKKKNEFGFCYQRGIIGIGWQVCDKITDPVPSGPVEYLKIMKCTWEKVKCAGKWEESANCITEMRIGDLVWTRNRTDKRLYLGKITGDWEYRHDCEYQHADIVSVRKCQLHEVRTADIAEADENPSDFLIAINKHLQNQSTVQKISIPENLKPRTAAIWEKIQKDVKENHG